MASLSTLPRNPRLFLRSQGVTFLLPDRILKVSAARCVPSHRCRTSFPATPLFQRRSPPISRSEYDIPSIHVSRFFENLKPARALWPSLASHHGVSHGNIREERFAYPPHIVPSPPLFFQMLPAPYVSLLPQLCFQAGYFSFCSRLRLVLAVSSFPPPSLYIFFPLDSLPASPSFCVVESSPTQPFHSDCGTSSSPRSQSQRKAARP